MKKIIIPTITKQGSIEKVNIERNLVIGTTVGLVKRFNEDSIGCELNKDFIRICIADGHWGSDASKLIVDHWLENKVVFPNSQIEAIGENRKIENKLFKKFGKPHMDSDKDFTPEASFIAIEIIGDKLSIVSYGDCRLLLANKGKMKFNLEIINTWLGAFSHLGLRNRLSVNQATKFKKIKLVKGDLVYLFTDGIDQCVYEKNTISFDFIANRSKLNNLSKVFDGLIKKVFVCGAQDNASLALIKF